MKSRAIRTFFKVILAFMIAPVILLAWVMICTGESKEVEKTSDIDMKNNKFTVYTNLETLEVEETTN